MRSCAVCGVCGARPTSAYVPRGTLPNAGHTGLAGFAGRYFRSYDAPHHAPRPVSAPNCRVEVREEARLTMGHAPLGRGSSPGNCRWITCGKRVNNLLISRLAPPAFYALSRVIPIFSTVYTHLSTTYPQAKSGGLTMRPVATRLCGATTMTSQC